jgi:hypothetical protein
MQLYRIHFTNIYNPEEEFISEEWYTEQDAVLIVFEHRSAQTPWHAEII